jgi:hypothetical protein
VRVAAVALVLVSALVGALTGCTAAPSPDPVETTPAVELVPGPDLPFGGDCTAVLDASVATEAVSVTVEPAEYSSLFGDAVSPESLGVEAAGGLLCDWVAPGETDGWVTVVVLPDSAAGAASEKIACEAPLEDEGATLVCTFGTIASGLWFSVGIGSGAGVMKADLATGAALLTETFITAAEAATSIVPLEISAPALACGDFSDIAPDSPSLVGGPVAGIANAPSGLDSALATTGYLACSFTQEGEETPEGELDGFAFSMLPTLVPDAAWARSRVEALGGTPLRLAGVDDAYLVSVDGVDTVHAFVGSSWIATQTFGTDIAEVIPVVEAIAAQLG